MATPRCLRALGIALAATLAAWAAQASSLPKLPASEGAPSLQEQLFAILVRDRARAIELAFGETFVPHMTTLLQESAREHNLTWPHPECGSLDIAQRLPCEMLVQGVAAHTTRIKAPLFNENRMSEIWPEDISELRALRNDDRAYQNVRKYGGYLLLRPLVREFGVARTLSYVAGTPFRIEDNNVRLSA